MASSASQSDLHSPSTGSMTSPPSSEEPESDAQEAPACRSFNRGALEKSGSFVISIVVHVALLLLLGLWMIPSARQALLPDIMSKVIETIDEEELTVELDDSMEVSTDAGITTPVPMGAEASGAVAAAAVAAELNEKVEEQVNQTTEVTLANIQADSPGTSDLISALPPGAHGDARAVVENYNQAMDRITQELLLLMSKQKVLVVWCFDQSDSMKDDQRDIRDRIERVYAELGLTGVNSDLLTSSIVSYGGSFILHTSKPTFDVKVIRKKIDEVPNDRSGKELMCRAVMTAIEKHRKYARTTHRRMALILVTDESGDQNDNERFLEPAVAAAKSADCIIYTLGREAVFGYPYAHIRWQHPQTLVIHKLPVDRGPETAFVEQLQTGGFRRRYDSFSSGYGPYAQSRLAQKSGGIFFMLPSPDSNLVGDEKRQYKLEAMRSYRPDLRSKAEILKDRELSELRRGVFQIIYDLNPYRPEVAKAIEMRVRFSPNPNEFVKQVGEELAKAKGYFLYLDRVTVAIEKLEHLREREHSLRWQANIDLIHAQLLAYKVRLYEYGAYLEYFMGNPTVIPIRKPPNLHLRWDIQVRSKTLTGALTAETIKRSQAVFTKIIKEHPGTPWAERAAWEMKRGFGVRLVATYIEIPKPGKPGGKLIPVPKL